MRESAQSWRELLLDLKRRGLSIGPEFAVAEGALGRRGMASDARPALLAAQDRQLPQQTAEESQQPKAKRALKKVWMAETKKDALAAFDAFVQTWGAKLH